MPYGSGKRLGETIDPRLMQADYSGFTNAAAITGNALTNIGQQIGSTVKEYSNNEKEIKKAIQISSAIEKGIPGLAPMAQEALGKLNDPNLSQRDRLAVAESIKDSLNIKMTGLQEQRAQEEFNMRKAAAGAAAGARGAAQANQIQEAQNLLKGFPSQIAILEASGFAPQAKALKDQYDLALTNGDVATATTIAGQASGFTANLKPSTLQPVEPDASPQEVASSLKDALEIGVTNAVVVPSNSVQLFNDSFKSGDFKRATKIASDITKNVNTQVETQQKESKDIVQLEDGSDILLGKTTGTRFTPDGRAIPRTSSIYNQPIAARETTIEEKTTKLAKARELYDKGNKVAALDLINAIGTGGLFGKTITMEELDSQMQQSGNKPASLDEEKLNELKSQFPE
jgi:hypothetical protein